MGDDHEGEPELALQVHQLELGGFAELLVQRRQRLVEQQELRPLGESACQRHTLPLAAGELFWAAPAQPVEAHERQHLADAAGDLRLVEPFPAQPIGDVVRDAHVREERVGLEHQVDRPLVGRQVGDVGTVEQDAAAIGTLESRQHPHQRGLAAAGGAEQREELARVERERHVIDRRDIAEALGHALDAHQRNRPGVGPGLKRTADAAGRGFSPRPARFHDVHV